jgi:hypothetical protein
VLTAAGICQQNVLDMVTLIDLKVKEELFIDWRFFCYASASATIMVCLGV